MERDEIEATLVLHDCVPVQLVDMYGMLRFGIWRNGRARYLDSAGNLLWRAMSAPIDIARLPAYQVFRNTELAQLCSAALEVGYVDT